MFLEIGWQKWRQLFLVFATVLCRSLANLSDGERHKVSGTIRMLRICTALFNLKNPFTFAFGPQNRILCGKCSDVYVRTGTSYFQTFWSFSLHSEGKPPSL